MKRLLALVCALALAATGCSSMLERDYVSVSRHVEYPVSEDSSILQAESYQGLVSALLYFVTQHDETGVIHLSNYVGDVGADLDAACAEVMEQDPLGAYALADIQHTHTRIVSYYEVTVAFEYAHTAQELDAIVTVTGSQAIFQALSQALTRFEGGCVLRLNYFTGDESTLLTQARQAWLDTPLAALAQPELQVKLYPDKGTSRVAEFTFGWPEEAQTLTELASKLESRARLLLQEMAPDPETVTAQVLADALRTRVTVDPQAGSTAYDALVDGAADSQGMALALQLLCQLSGMESTVVEGRLNGESRFWLIVPTEEGYRHLDPSADAPACETDRAFQEAGYEWAADRYPDCTDYGAPSEPAETEESGT